MNTLFQAIGLLIAAGMFAVAYLQYVQLKQTNETALNALIEARKASDAARMSAEAYLASERGLLVFVNEGLANNPFKLYFQFRNAGKSALVIQHFQALTILRMVQFKWHLFRPALPKRPGNNSRTREQSSQFNILSSMTR